MAKRYRDLRIEFCGECPFFELGSSFEGYDDVGSLVRCHRTNRSVPDVNSIPGWCPLVNARD